jgi:hypothetical protein
MKKQEIIDCILKICSCNSPFGSPKYTGLINTQSCSGVNNLVCMVELINIPLFL